MKIRIYRGGETRELPAIDYTDAWKKQGWRESPDPGPFEQLAQSQGSAILEESPEDLGLVQTQSGYDFEPDEEEAEEETLCPALDLINKATEAEDITPIKRGIGPASAKKLLESRPINGYESLEHAQELNPELSRTPYNVKWQQVAEWEADDHS